jgi:3-oxoacyl-[acyl-carrier-protein] synthase III
MQHLIIHQTSRRSLRDGMRAINKAFGRTVSHEGNTIDNLAHRGNTGSTSYFVALWDHMLSGRIRSGEKVFFAVSGSGQTIGTSICTLDDLPDRLRAQKERGVGSVKARVQKKSSSGQAIVQHPISQRVCITAVGTQRLTHGIERDTSRLVVAAAEQCLAQWGGDRSDIDLVLFAGMTRSGYVGEPAIAAFIAGDLKINDLVRSPNDKKTLAFDVVNAGASVLNACHLAGRMIQAGRCRTALIVASEVDVNRDDFPEHPIGLLEAGSALIVERSPHGRRGFGRFVYNYAPQHQHARSAIGVYAGGKPLCQMHLDSRLEAFYLETVLPAAEEAVRSEGLSMSDLRLVLPSQFSPTFPGRLAVALGIAQQRVVQLPTDRGDYFTNSLAFTLQHAYERKLVQPGDVGLIINAASGLQAGCAAYYF